MNIERRLLAKKYMYIIFYTFICLIIISMFQSLFYLIYIYIYILLSNVLSKITWIMNLKEIKTLFNFIIKYGLLVSQVNLHLQNLFNN